VTPVEKMIERAFAIGAEMIEAGNAGYIFLVDTKRGGRIETAFEEYHEDQGYLESMRPDEPILLLVDEIVAITVEAV